MAAKTISPSANEPPAWERLANYMQRGDTIGAEIGVYAISGALFAVAYHKIRPFTKFGRPSDIPAHFVRQRVKQQGRVVAVQPSANGPLLSVDHRPPLNLLIGSTKTLPVKIIGVSINPNGYSWLQSVTVNHRIEFVPLLANSSSQFAECQVLMADTTSDKQTRVLDLATCLMELGFAHAVDVPRPLANDPQLAKYFAALRATEKTARRRRAGQWAQILPPPIWPIPQLQALTITALYSMLPPKWRLPQLVR